MDTARSTRAVQLVLGQGRDDQQRQVGAGGAGLPELVGGDDEVLAQHGYVDRGAHRAEVLEAAAEAPLLGEHADRGGPAGGVVGGQRGRVGDRGERALAGAGPLDLGDHADAGGAEGRHRVERVGRAAGERLQVVERVAASRSARSTRTPSMISSRTDMAASPLVSSRQVPRLSRHTRPLVPARFGRDHDEPAAARIPRPELAGRPVLGGLGRRCPAGPLVGRPAPAVGPVRPAARLRPLRPAALRAPRLRPLRAGVVRPAGVRLPRRARLRPALPAGDADQRQGDGGAVDRRRLAGAVLVLRARRRRPRGGGARREGAQRDPALGRPSGRRGRRHSRASSPARSRWCSACWSSRSS